jgi:uncharacterized coiled-coil protein SlyX
MFQSLRPNNQIFILHKDKPSLDVGSIISVSVPAPKYPVQPMFGQPQELVVDIVAKVNNQDVTYQKIPANLDVADFGNNSIVLSDNKEAMNSEIMCLKQRSLDIINSVDYHNNVITECDKLLNSLNPDLAEKQAQNDKIQKLEQQLEKLMDINKKLIARLDVETLKQVNNESLGA